MVVVVFLVVKHGCCGCGWWLVVGGCDCVVAVGVVGIVDVAAFGDVALYCFVQSLSP